MSTFEVMSQHLSEQIESFLALLAGVNGSF
jgi:hypothetical protein